MKTIKEAASEYVGDKEAFIDGVKFAHRWISVEDELPESNRVVLVKNDRDRKSVGWYIQVYTDWVIAEFPSSTKEFGNVIHWRPIELPPAPKEACARRRKPQKYKN